MTTQSDPARLNQAIDDLNAKIKEFRRKNPKGDPKELRDLLKDLADSHSGSQAINAAQPLSAPPINPSLDFGVVEPNTTGPNVFVDPSFGPPAISFNGGVTIDSAPASATVSASIIGDTRHFRVRDITTMEWVLEPIDPRRVAAWTPWSTSKGESS
jgi:hypothetical protein